MNIHQLEDYAWRTAVGLHFAEYPEDMGIGDIMDILENIPEDGLLPDSFIVADRYEYDDPHSVVNSVTDLQSVLLYDYKDILRKVNGEEWFADFCGVAR